MATLSEILAAHPEGAAMQATMQAAVAVKAEKVRKAIAILSAPEPTPAATAWAAKRTELRGLGTRVYRPLPATRYDFAPPKPKGIRALGWWCYGAETK